MVIDFHTHIYPEKIAAKAVVSIGDFYGLTASRNGTAEDLLARGKQGGIDRFVVFSAAAVPGQVTGINSYIASVCAEHPEFSGFGTIHAEFPNPEPEIRRIKALGLRGIKLHPDMQKFTIDDERMMSVYDIIRAEGMAVVLHTGDYRYPYSHPARLARVLDAFPGLVVVAAHFGGWSVQDLALEYLKDRFCYMDVSSSIPFIGSRRAEELIGIYGADRFLFGSDFPMWDPLVCLEEFLALRLSEADREKILCGNALRILEGPR
ncbi:MAG: amidohydrolase family protein [Spirochaetaceae bacterium]|jgi:predicted TIM-barrel fold metal-dependent hydrolase|nr:amidohydrolase family protein [Spirochaetaceae bacterium]